MCVPLCIQAKSRLSFPSLALTEPALCAPAKPWSLGRAAPTVTVQYLQGWDGGLVGLISVCKGSDWLDGSQTNTLPTCVSGSVSAFHTCCLIDVCSIYHKHQKTKQPPPPTHTSFQFSRSSCNNHFPCYWYDFKKIWINVIRATAVACVVCMESAGRIEGRFTHVDDALKVI